MLRLTWTLRRSWPPAPAAPTKRALPNLLVHPALLPALGLAPLAVPVLLLPAPTAKSQATPGATVSRGSEMSRTTALA